MQKFLISLGVLLTRNDRLTVNLDQVVIELIVT